MPLCLVQLLQTQKQEYEERCAQPVETLACPALITRATATNRTNNSPRQLADEAKTRSADEDRRCVEKRDLASTHATFPLSLAKTERELQFENVQKRWPRQIEQKWLRSEG